MRPTSDLKLNKHATTRTPYRTAAEQANSARPGHAAQTRRRTRGETTPSALRCPARRSRRRARHASTRRHVRQIHATKRLSQRNDRVAIPGHKHAGDAQAGRAQWHAARAQQMRWHRPARTNSMLCLFLRLQESVTHLHTALTSDEDGYRRSGAVPSMARRLHATGHRGSRAPAATSRKRLSIAFCAGRALEQQQ